jgi:rubredoxin
MPWSERERDAESFANVLSAFDGRRYVLDAGSSKVLRLLLEHPEGCDAQLSPDRLEVQFGWHVGRHRYFLRLAPAAVSRILELAACPAGTRDFHGTLPSIDQGEWSCGKRRVWLRASLSAVALHVRNAESGESQFESTPPPLQETIPSPRFMNLPAPLPCPHCGVAADSFRHLHEGSLVCGSCGASFEPTV